MKYADMATMICKVNRAFAVMARTMMDDADTESEQFGILVQIDKDCQTLADDMARLAMYANVHADEEIDRVLREAFGDGDTDK